MELGVKSPLFLEGREGGVGDGGVGGVVVTEPRAKGNTTCEASVEGRTWTSADEGGSGDDEVEGTQIKGGGADVGEAGQSAESEEEKRVTMVHMRGAVTLETHRG